MGLLASGVASSMFWEERAERLRVAGLLEHEQQRMPSAF